MFVFIYCKTNLTLVGANFQFQLIIGFSRKGRHVTTSRSLIEIPDGGVLLDTPGMREFQLWEEQGGLSTTFSDIEQLKGQCKFSNCQHETEPDCAINIALENGELKEDRYISYLKFCKEQRFNQQKIAWRKSVEVKRKLKKK